MKVLRNTLEVEIETWDDPGDYPSGAGSGPLPSYNYVACVSGEIELELEAEDEVSFKEIRGDEANEGRSISVTDYMIDYEGIETDLPHHTRVTKWKVLKAEGLRATFEVEEFEAGEVERHPDDYEYEED